ncbi:branched-chain amino acid aminotransferase [Alkalibacter rhizosphaerae]|uniref:Branched-chain-amino-acid aminotransferase n=1 Tax=Alkalibacter rhizosphaerae TaxID=2815577 RepID=A0A974XJ41_9FIRM|nr:branched-chain amino acid aminotransferase [Alkalibacter rhizosphaerae]QSX09705.1 branched-chain amino acid aminotransferase [Alkalibacter rhizosphaerae]
MEIRITKNDAPKQKPDENNLGFGNYFTDHMFVMDYDLEKGWHDPRIEPYGPLSLDPSAMVFHYGQETFEGLKAYRNDQGNIQLFRVMDNLNRLNQSNERMCIPTLDVEAMFQGIKELILLDGDWVPSQPGTSLYVRPFVIATDPFLGVRPASTYKFLVILSPVGAYYKGGLNPTRIYVEEYYVRAVAGGTGFAKTGGNYAASLKAQVEANEKGYNQVLWLDGKEHKYIEEVGTSNAFFKIDGKVYTAPLEGSILSGITRNSTITLLKDWGLEVVEEKMTIQQLAEHHKAGRLEEAFATGTAAVISPIGVLGWQGEDLVINDNQIGEVSQKLYDTMTAIQYGKVEDEFGWVIQL